MCAPNEEMPTGCASSTVVRPGRETGARLRAGLRGADAIIEAGGVTLPEFTVVSEFQPTGDQPAAIEKLVGGLRKGLKHQTLLGVTGSGKTYTMACVIAQLQRPTLVVVHNKTLAAQLASEFREFFPNNAVEY